MTKRQTFFNMIKETNYLDEFNFFSNETEKKIFNNGDFRWTIIKENYDNEIEIRIQYTNIYYLLNNNSNEKFLKTKYNKEKIIWKCDIYETKNITFKNRYKNSINDNGLFYTNFRLSKNQNTFM